MNKTRGRSSLYLGQIRQVDGAAAERLLIPFSIPFLGWNGFMTVGWGVFGGERKRRSCTVIWNMDVNKNEQRKKKHDI